MCPVQEKKLLIIRPRVVNPPDYWTMYTYDASEHFASDAQKNGWTVVKELDENLANRAEVEYIIQSEKPNLVIHYGHGWTDRLWGQNNNQKESVLSCALGEENVKLLSSTSTSTVSCWSALDLGKRAVEENKSRQKTYFLGYDIPIYCDYDRRYYFNYWRAANAANDALIAGRTFQDAWKIGYDKYTEEYNKLLALRDPYVKLWIAPLLLSNRDHFKLWESTRGPTLAARVPMFGNSIIVQRYLRKIRDKIFSKKAHERLHPLV